MTLWVSATISHHAASNKAMTANAGRLALSFCSRNDPENSACSPQEPTPRRIRLFVHDHRHLTARMGRAGKLIAAGHFERQAKALARHHQGRTEDLRHLIHIFQQQYIPDAERQKNLGRQNLHLISPAMRRAQVPLGISKVSSREAKVTGVNAAQATAADAPTVTMAMTIRRRL
jgi:hypothetical protein